MVDPTCRQGDPGRRAPSAHLQAELARPVEMGECLDREAPGRCSRASARGILEQLWGLPPPTSRPPTWRVC